jgi:hypothetical protein
MARKDFTGLVQAASGPGAPGTLFNPTFTALTGFTGLMFPNTGKEVVEIINGATAATYTVNVGATLGGHAAAADGPTALPVSNTAPQRLGPFPTYYNQPGSNMVWIDFSNVTTVTAAVTQTPGVF